MGRNGCNHSMDAEREKANSTGAKVRMAHGRRGKLSMPRKPSGMYIRTLSAISDVRADFMFSGQEWMRMETAFGKFMLPVWKRAGYNDPQIVRKITKTGSNRDDPEELSTLLL